MRYAVAFFACVACLCGCDATIRSTDREVARVIAQRQRESLSYEASAGLEPQTDRSARAGSPAYDRKATRTKLDVPPAFIASESTTWASTPTSDATASMSATSSAPDSMPTSTTMPTSGMAASQPTKYRSEPITLLSAIDYAERNRRGYQTAKEDLYLVTLALMLERHLWTPIFAAELRSVYGNYGELRNFDSAMRFVADLSMSQRLPYGGEFTARAVSTLVRDIRKGINAEEGGNIEVGLNVPLLRGAGHVAQEELIQLERDLTYAVRDFERFRRRQFVDIAREYFDLLRAKQEVLDADTSLATAFDDFERASAQESTGQGTILDTRRAEQRWLSEQNRVEQLRESFRAQTDRFKLELGMPVDEGIGLEDLENIETLERQVQDGLLPLLQQPCAASDEKLALDSAIERRLDLLNRADQIDDSRRGVQVAKNRLLPDLGWNTTLGIITDPSHFRTTDYEWERATWRSEMVLSLPLERTQERNDYRRALIDVRRSERNHQEQLERIRAEVRATVNQIRLQNTLVEIQIRNLDVAERRREFARLEFNDGKLGNRDLVEAENEWTAARNALNQAKTSRWAALLEFRIATETLLLDNDDGDGKLDVAATQP